MRTERGFTFLEVFMVITIFGILSAVAFIKLNSFVAHNQLEKAVWKVMKDLALARPMAMANDCQVIVDLSVLNQYSIHVDGDNDGVLDAGEKLQTFTVGAPVGFGLSSTPPTSAPSGATLPSGSEWLAGQWKTNKMRISKNALGSINSGSLYLRSTRVSNITYCIVATSTAQNLKMYKWNGSSWNALR